AGRRIEGERGGDGRGGRRAGVRALRRSGDRDSERHRPRPGAGHAELPAVRRPRLAQRRGSGHRHGPRVAEAVRPSDASQSAARAANGLPQSELRFGADARSVGSQAYTLHNFERLPTLIRRRGLMGAKRAARREFLRTGAALAGGFTLGAAAPALAQAPAQAPMIKGEREGEIAYGARSKYVTSARIPHGGRPTPDAFGLTFHVATPLQDSVGVITPSSLHYFATTRGAYLPDIDPKQHTLIIHCLVD